MILVVKSKILVNMVRTVNFQWKQRRHSNTREHKTLQRRKTRYHSKKIKGYSLGLRSRVRTTIILFRYLNKRKKLSKNVCKPPRNCDTGAHFCKKQKFNILKYVL